jgi:predicted DNA-binding transcriptional regulator YafY
MDYVDAQEQATRRIAWPLALYFWGGIWLVVAWCELRNDFRTFRLDRIREIVAGEGYPSQEGRRLPDFIRAMQQQNGRS